MVSIKNSSKLSKVDEYLNKIIQDFEKIKIINDVSKVEIPVVYGGEFGPDLDRVAKHCGLSKDEVVAQHSKEEYLVYLLVFQLVFHI